jgi:hypothetical protein
MHMRPTHEGGHKPLWSKHVLLNGLYNMDIKSKILSMEGIETKTLVETINIIKAKETGVGSRTGTDTGAGTLAAASTYKKTQKISPSDKRLNQTTMYKDCLKMFKNVKIQSSLTQEDRIVKFEIYQTC